MSHATPGTRRPNAAPSEPITPEPDRQDPKAGPAPARNAASPRVMIETPRLRLCASEAVRTSSVLAFYLRNQQHFAPWDPPMPPDFLTEGAQARRLTADAHHFSEGTALRWWLLSPTAGGPQVLGQLHFSQVARGAFHNAMLGYALDVSAVGQGLMQEALRAALAEVFGPAMRLHRVQANVRPENLRSRALLERLGFVLEGRAAQYLYIDGAWRDHLMLALLNPDWGSQTLAPG